MLFFDWMAMHRDSRSKMPLPFRYSWRPARSHPQCGLLVKTGNAVTIRNICPQFCSYDEPFVGRKPNRDCAIVIPRDELRPAYLLCLRDRVVKAFSISTEEYWPSSSAQSMYAQNVRPCFQQHLESFHRRYPM